MNLFLCIRFLGLIEKQRVDLIPFDYILIHLFLFYKLTLSFPFIIHLESLIRE